ncbi:MAG: hypothetical protein M9907_19260 [Burkholderiaceae bacterium]|nr:hypothetical protein [Burkholderiaceae bacterium]
MDVSDRLFEIAARLAGASAMLRGRDDYDNDDELIFVDRLAQDARRLAMSTAEAIAYGKPEVTR